MVKNRVMKPVGAIAKTYAPLPLGMLLVICLGGWILVGVLTKYGEKQERDNIISRAVTSASTFDPGLIAGLKGDSSDINTGGYAEVRKQLMRIKNSNPDVRFVYLMRMRNGGIVFLADSEFVDSPDYSAPGDVYNEASPELLRIFTDGLPFVEGPLRDRWGTWVSGHAPIVHPESGTVVSVFGMDMEAGRWFGIIRTYRFFGIIIAGLVGVISIVFIATFLIQKRSRERIFELNRTLERELRERSAMSGALAKSEKKFRTLFDRMLNGFAYHKIVTDENGVPVDYVFLEVNDAFERQTGLKREAIIGKRVSTVLPGIVSADFDWIGFYGGVALHGEERKTEMPINFQDRERWFSVSAYSPERGFFSVIFEDVTEKKRLEDELLALSLTDELTGLYNRRGFFALAEQQFRILKRTRRKACLIYIDLDGLKAINDTMGHETGDNYIRAAGEVLKGCFRDSDIIARVGGDEFVVFPINADCESSLITDRLKACIGRSREKWGIPGFSMSMGVGHYDPERPMSLDDLLKAGDRAMYEDKARKKREG